MSLQKTLRVAVITVALVTIIFLSFLSGYAFIEYRNSIRNDADIILFQHTQTTTRDFAAINSEMYDIYSYDENYAYLSHSYGVDSMNAVYSLNDRLKTLLTMENRYSGYIIFFDNFENRNYYFTQNVLTYDDIEQMKEIALAVAESDLNRAWSVNMIGDSVYAICVYNSSNVALCEFYRLSDVADSIIDEIGIKGSKVIFEYNNRLYCDKYSADTFEGINTRTDTLNGYYIIHKSISNVGITIYAAVPINIWTLVNTNQIFLFVITISVIVAAVILYKQMKKQLLIPLEQLTTDMKVIGAGDMDRKLLSTSQFTEIQTVIDTTDAMIDEIEKQKLTVYEKTIESQRANLQYLSLQLKPHFYLNGLKTLNVMAMKGDRERLQDVIMHLSFHLRYLLNLEKQLVPLKDEIDYVNNYASLQREMTDRPLKIEWNIGVDISDWLVPNLSIQTFVENSFKYARLGNTTNELVIFITINELGEGEERLLDLYIRDNGLGYPDEMLEIINGTPNENNEHVGINNLKRRCNLIYTQGFECVFLNDNGAVSNLFLPYVNQEEMT